MKRPLLMLWTHPSQALLNPANLRLIWWQLLNSSVGRLGRRLETRLRIAFIDCV